MNIVLINQNQCYNGNYFKKLPKSPRPIRVFNRQNGSHPLTREYRDVDRDEFYI